MGFLEADTETEYDMQVIFRDTCEKKSAEAEVDRGRSRIVMQAQQSLIHPLREFWRVHSPLELSPNYPAEPLYPCFTQSQGKDQSRKGMALNEAALSLSWQLEMLPAAGKRISA